MLYQVMFSGSVKRDAETVLNGGAIEYTLNRAKLSNITGLTAYADGSYLSLIEGDKVEIDESIEKLENSDLFTSNLIMISSPIEKRQFPDYSFGIRYEDAVGSFIEFKQCFKLTSESLDTKLPEAIPESFQTLFRTFAQVNQLRSA